jgi:HlyD family secretion protein
MRKAVLIGAFLAIPVVVAGLSMSSMSVRPAAPKQSTHVEPAHEPAWIQGIGYVEPVSEIRKLVFKVNGVIARCNARVGDSYKQGDVLFELNNDEQRAAMELAEKDLRVAEANRDKVLSGIHKYQIEAAARKVELCKEQVRYWQKEHDRVKGLAARNSISNSEYEKTLTEMVQHVDELRQAEAEHLHLENFVRPVDRVQAEAGVFAAQAKLNLAKRQFEDTFLHAPFDGTILEILKREGEGSRLFDPEPLAIFGDLSQLRVRAEVDERYVSFVRVNQKALVFGRGLGEKSYPARVHSIKTIMGKKTVFSRAAAERKDLDVLQVLIELDGPFSAPVGLEVDVKILDSY